MAIDFPNTPATNDTYTYGGRTWKYNGTAWDFVTATYGTNFTSSNFIAVTESMNISATAASGTVNLDALTASKWYYTTVGSATFTLNFRGSSTTTLSSLIPVGSSMTLVFQVSGASTYYPNVFQIDGVAVTPKWLGGTAPTSGNASSTDIYTFEIQKTASTPTYVVIASATKAA